MEYPLIIKIGFLLNICLFIIVMLKRYIPVIIRSRKVKQLEQQGKKFVKFKATDSKNIIAIALMITCIVLVLVPYAFTLFVVLSIQPSRDFRDDLR